MAIHTANFLESNGYTAADDRSVVQDLVLAQPGVADLATHGLITAGGGLTVSVSATRCFIAGNFSATQGYYHFWSDAATTVTLATADLTNPRIDTIIARVYDSIDGGAGSNQATIEAVTGTPQGGAALSNLGVPTGAPTVPSSSLVLGYVLVGAGAGSLSAAVIQDGRQIYGASRGATSITATESRTNVAFGLLTTPDQVRNLVLPTNGLIAVAYQATWQESVGNAAQAAIFVGANQLKIQNQQGKAPVVQWAKIMNVNTPVPNTDTALATFPGGLVGGGAATGFTPDVTTGQVVGMVGNGGQAGEDKSLGAFATGTNTVFYQQSAAGNVQGIWATGPCYLFAAAGTYTISVQFLASSGSVTAKNRKLWVWVKRF